MIHSGENRMETASRVTIWPLSVSALAAGPGWARRAAAGSRGSGWGDSPRSQAFHSDETLQTQRHGSPGKEHWGKIGMDRNINWNSAEPAHAQLPDWHWANFHVDRVNQDRRLRGALSFYPVSDEVEGFKGLFLPRFMGTHGSKIKVLTGQYIAFLWLASSDSKCWSSGRGTMRAGFGREGNYKWMCLQTVGAMRLLTSYQFYLFLGS